MARTSRLAEPGFAKTIAEAYIDGMSRPEMAEMFGVHKDTISAWTKDPRVQAFAARFAQERVNQITRKVDATIEGRLQEAEKLDIDTLLKIRREFLDRALKIDLGQAQQKAEAADDAIKAFEKDPALIDTLIDALNAQK